VVQRLETTLIRVGNEEYARKYRSYGLTTLRDSHVDVSGSRLRLRFPGKSGRAHVIGLQDRRLSRIVKRCADLPGQQLFQYLDRSGRRRALESAHVTAYLRGASDRDFTAKGFRTWAGTVLAAWALLDGEPPTAKARAKRTLTRAIASVAERLRHTRAPCRCA